MSLLVTATDPGIRPAGGPEACFYCAARVGSIHGPECVTIVREVVYGVFCTTTGNRLGTWRTTEPAHWSREDGQQHKNESSWCADNVRDEEYDGDPFPGPDCACGWVEFRCESRGADVRRSHA